jgi:hypothetical protein
MLTPPTVCQYDRGRVPPYLRRSGAVAHDGFRAETDCHKIGKLVFKYLLYIDPFLCIWNHAESLNYHLLVLGNRCSDFISGTKFAEEQYIFFAFQ